MSEQQIALAEKIDNIEYRQEFVESANILENSIDLITIASSIHWFDHEAFYRKVDTVAKRGAIIAFWMYGWPIISDEIDKIRTHYFYNIPSSYWDKRSDYWHAKYETVPLPYKEFETPPFEIKCVWNCKQLVEFLKSSSAAQVYLDRNNYHPIELIQDDLVSICGDKSFNAIFPIYLRAAIIEK